METVRVMEVMSRTLDRPSAEYLDRVVNFTSEQLVANLTALEIRSDYVKDIAGHWSAFRDSTKWVQLLAAVSAAVETHRGDIDAPIPVWPDFSPDDPCGRYFYFFLFAICAEGTVEYLEKSGFPSEMIGRTLEDLRRHCATHVKKWGTIGVDAGWWMLPTLRGELVQVGSLQFHRVTLGVGSLSPSPWYSPQEAFQRGAGFRQGDPSLGLHIPQQTDLSPKSVDASIGEARDVLNAVWPVSQRRLVTCQSWMLDDRLGDWLAPNSNIVRFQSRFTMLPVWLEDDEDVIEFVFRQPNVAIEQLPQETSLERAVVGVLKGGSHWRDRTGWFDLEAR